MSTVAAMLADLKAQILTVPNVGVVWDHEFFDPDYKAFLANFSSTIAGQKSVRGWVLAWKGLPNTDLDDGAMGLVADEYVFDVTGYLAVSETGGSAATFEALVEAVVAAVRTRGRAMGVPGNLVEYSASMTVAAINLRLFGPTLCHVAEGKLSCIVKHAVTYA